MQPQRFIPKAKLEERVEAVLDLARNKNVLHIGMGGRISDSDATAHHIATALTRSVHARLAQVTSDLTGLDINPLMVDAMRKVIPGNYVIADITEPGLANKLDQRFEVVLFLEVIEHLECFRAAFDNLRGLLATGGTLVISTINAYCIERFVKMLFRYESVHEEHTSYFSYQTMARLLDMNGFKIDRFSFTVERRREFSTLFDRAGYYGMRATTAAFPQYAEGVLFVARVGQ